MRAPPPSGAAGAQGPSTGAAASQALEGLSARPGSGQRRRGGGAVAPREGEVQGEGSRTRLEGETVPQPAAQREAARSALSGHE